ncbi:MAG TPA: hypothetical protein VHU42_04165 [Rhodopila sp.]|jgi:hypothetical protein|nr:hypothetical protein [Rhodopila sp.]
MTGRLLACALALLSAAQPVNAGPQSFDLDLHVPPVIADSTAPTKCTVTYVIADLANNDLYAARMRIDPAETDSPVHNRLPCPPDMPPRVGLRALDVCVSRSGESKYCVFADMSRGFEQRPDIHNTAENASRCASDKASDIGVACWMSGKLSVCNVACADSPQDALVRARARCEDKQQHDCPITATVPVSGP